MIKYSGIVIFVIISGLGFLALLRAMRARQKSKLAQTWPTTEGTILESALKEEPARNAIGNINLAYVLQVQYEYVVSGKTYQGDRVSFGTPAFNYITGSNLLENYEEGTKTSVSYNPENPAESVLAPKTTVGMPSPVLGIFLIAAGVIVGLLSIF